MKNPAYERCAKCGKELNEEYLKDEVRVIHHEKRMKKTRYNDRYTFIGAETKLRVVLCSGCLDGAADAVRAWVGGDA